MASKSKTLFTVNSIMSTVILSMVLASTAQRYQTEALQIPADNEPSLQSMARNEASLSHRADSNYYLVDEANYPNDGSVQSLPNKRAWSNLHGSWGKRSANGVVYSDANNIDPDSGNDEYVDLMLLLLNQPYIRNAENADLNRPAAHEYANANDLPNENKRAWTFNDYWPIRFNTRNSANRYRGGYGKREPAWNNLKGLWGKRSWNSLNAGWGKRATDQSSSDAGTSATDDKLNYY